MSSRATYDVVTLAALIRDIVRVRLLVNHRKVVFTFAELAQLIYSRHPSGGQPRVHDIEQACRRLPPPARVLPGRIALGPARRPGSA